MSTQLIGRRLSARQESELHLLAQHCPDPDELACKPLEFFQELHFPDAQGLVAVKSLWHASCSGHLFHAMTCADFELLLARSNLLCERCRKPNERLYIDHDHTDYTIRGLVCPSCNRHMSFVDDGTKPCDQMSALYLASPYIFQHPFEGFPRYKDAHLARRRQRAVEIARHRQRLRDAGRLPMLEDERAPDDSVHAMRVARKVVIRDANRVIAQAVAGGDLSIFTAEAAAA